MKHRIKAAGATDIGRRRSKNDDAYCCNPQGHIFAVADGMGQLPFGDATAMKSCELIESQAKKAYMEYETNGHVYRGAKYFKKSLEYISNRIYLKGNGPDRFRYGSTFCGVMEFGRFLAIVNLGDSRAYAVYSKGITSKPSIKLLTQDHNVAWLAVTKGYMTAEDAKRNGLASRLTRFVGMSEESEADLIVIPKKGIRDIILCSDGLYGMLSDQEIAKTVRNHRDPNRVCKHLIRMANQKGGKDNITVVDIRLK